MRAKGDVVVEDRVQKRKIAATAKPSETRVCGFMSSIVLREDNREKEVTLEMRAKWIACTD